MTKKKAYFLIIDKGVKETYLYPTQEDADIDGANQRYDYIVVPVKLTAKIDRMFDFKE